MQKYIIDFHSNLKEALEKIEKNKKGFILVCNGEKQLLGILTDGDIRRRLLINSDINQSIMLFLNKDYTYVFDDVAYENIYKKLDDQIQFIPVLNKEKQLVSVITKDNIPQRKERTTYVRAKAPVRVSFGGGGSDITQYFTQHAAAVINATISIYSHATLYLNHDKKIQINSSDLDETIEYKDIHHLNKTKDAFELIKALVQTIKPDHGFSLYLQSDFPMSSGLGGSSVVLASIIGCFNELRRDKWSLYDMAEIAFEAERLHLNIAGGWQDQYATVFGGFNFIEFRKEENIVYPLRLPENTLLELEESLILCYTNTQHDSNTIHLNQKKNISDEQVLESIKANVALTFEMKNFLLKGNLLSFGKGLDQAWHLKKKCSQQISNAVLDKIYDDAKQNGATGGKLLGAGGGGYFLFFVEPIKRNQLISWIKKIGLQYTAFKFEKSGMKSWTVRT